MKMEITLFEPSAVLKPVLIKNLANSSI